MKKPIFVNLAVNDLPKTMEFFKALGFTFNMQFTDEKAACMIINDDAFVMLLSEPFFKTFLRNTELSDPRKVTEVLIAISAESRERVDEFVEKAFSLGATEARPAEDHGFMYGRSFHDPDGHIWEIAWMDMQGVQ